MRKLTITCTLVLLTLLSFAQNSEPDFGLSSTMKADISLQGLGISADLKIGKNIMLELSTGAGAGYNIYEGGFNYAWAILQPSLYLYASPKFFYNRKKRFEKGKSMDRNSGNYFGFRLKYTTADISNSGVIRDAFIYNIHWGMQRQIGNRWVFYTQFGGGYAMDINSGFGTIYPSTDLKFSYILSKKKK